MVTEEENLKFRYFNCLFIIGVTKHNRIHIVSKKLLKRNTNDYNDFMMYLGHI